jgi:phage baseplate assembly protein W
MIMANIYSDMDMELNMQADGDIRKDTDVQAIFNSLENIVTTIQGQRRMRPDFAYGPYNFLFEAITADNAERLGEVLNSAIELYENRIIVRNTHIEYDTANNQYKASINFELLGRTNIIENVSYILKRL